MEEEEVEDEKTDEKGAGVGKGVSGAERSGWFVFVCFVFCFCFSVLFIGHGAFSLASGAAPS